MIITAKLISICLGLALTAFTVSTIVLAVQKSNLQKDLDEARDKIDQLESGFTSSTASTPTTTTTLSPTTSGPTAEPEPTAEPGPTAEPAPTESPEKIDYRLPSSLIPTNYDLYLNPNVETGLFTGHEIINITVLEATDKIVLHSLYLTIDSVQVYQADGSAWFEVESFTFDSVREFLIINLKEQLKVDTFVLLNLEFSGTMANKIVGLYSSSYVKADETRKWIATSKFEPTYARQAFPCFDEPALKATFEITLVHPTTGNYHALSNMNPDVEVNQGTYTEVQFAKSVPMSTYLACFIVSDFEAKTVAIDTKGIGQSFDMGVYATPEQLDKVDFALEVGKGVIEYYIDYFQIEYPLPKLDMAAIPDFVSGAMEHWGLVTYRETSLLYEEATSSTVNKQSIASVIAHEFAHMWFGNLGKFLGQISLAMC